MQPDAIHRCNSRTHVLLLLVFLCCCCAVAADVPTAPEASDSESLGEAPNNLTIVYGLSRDGLGYSLLQTVLPYLKERFDNVTVTCL